MRNRFLAIIEQHEAILHKKNHVFNIIGMAKILLTIIAGFLIYLMYVRSLQLEYVVLFIIVFITLTALWVYQNELSKTINFSKGIITVCNRQTDRINGKWKEFQDTGAEFIDRDHAYSSDLDVVGEKSLFQFLNSTHTWPGRQAFANDLLHANYDAAELRIRQEAIEELSQDLTFSCETQYYLSLVGSDNYSIKLTRDLQDIPSLMKNIAIKIVLTYGPILSLAAIAGIIACQQRHLYYIAILIAALQTVIWIIGMPKTHKFLQPMLDLPNSLGAYNEIINEFSRRDFSSAKLRRLKEELSLALPAIKDLGKIESRISVKNNGLIYFLLNVFLMWDYRCAYKLEEWKKKYAPLAERWFLALGEFESLLCFSHLPNICDNTCLPLVSELSNTILADDIGHPLLPNESRVNNRLNINNSIFIISGSNMSGKTTFLRTVGINLVLARAGGFACARKMSFPPLHIMTSMRLADNLDEGVSTFYAELRRIKKIIALAENQPETLFLIDEIFKGTNSVDRLIGAETVLTKLNDLGVIGLTSTHDLELCQLADTHDRIMNFNFSEYYRDNEICFDYTIRPGKSNTTNARYLMKMVGILEE